MTERSAELNLERKANHCAEASLYKGWPRATVQTLSCTHQTLALVTSVLQANNKRMKRRRLLLSLPLLPTITETLEDSSVHPSCSQPTHGSDSLCDYMMSIQALARPAVAQSCGPIRIMRSPKLRQLSKPQMKLSGSISRVSPLTLRTSRSALSGNRSEDFSLHGTKELDFKGKDPVDWLFGQMS